MIGRPRVDRCKNPESVSSENLFFQASSLREIGYAQCDVATERDGSSGEVGTWAVVEHRDVEAAASRQHGPDFAATRRHMYSHLVGEVVSARRWSSAQLAQAETTLNKRVQFRHGVTSSRACSHSVSSRDMPDVALVACAYLCFVFRTWKASYRLIIRPPTLMISALSSANDVILEKR